MKIVKGVRADREAGMSYDEIVEKWGIGRSTASKYVNLPEDKVEAFVNQHRTVPRAHKGDCYKNVIYKMMADGHDYAVIVSYLRSQDVEDALGLIEGYLKAVRDHHFPSRKQLKLTDVVVRRSRAEKAESGLMKYTRSQILREILVTNPKTKLDEQLQLLLPAIEEKYPVVAWVRHAFAAFHAVMMGDSTEALDAFLAEYGESLLADFCTALARDLEPIRNAIRYELSSGFVEGCNNKFKTGKRACYGRNSLPSLQKRSLLLFAWNKPGFDIHSAINYDPPGRLLKAA